MKQLKGSTEIIIRIAIMGACLLGMRGCNALINNRDVETPAYEMHSVSTGIIGHKEYTQYADGSQDVKVYPNWGHRIFGSELYQDFDGDGLVDRIRENGSEFVFHRLHGLHVREYDFDTHTEDFLDADETLLELMQKYNH